MDEIINYNFRLGFFDKPFFRLKPSSDTLRKMQSDREFSNSLHFTQELQRGKVIQQGRMNRCTLFLLVCTVRLAQSCQSCLMTQMDEISSRPCMTSVDECMQTRIMCGICSTLLDDFDKGAYPTYCILLSASHRSERALIYLQPKGCKLQNFPNLCGNL